LYDDRQDAGIVGVSYDLYVDTDWEERGARGTNDAVVGSNRPGVYDDEDSYDNEDLYDDLVVYGDVYDGLDSYSDRGFSSDRGVYDDLDVRGDV
jgi:hypothetical protein